MIASLYSDFAEMVQALRFETGFTILPADFKGDLPAPPFVKTELLLPTARPLYQSSRVSGSMIFQLYDRSGAGQAGFAARYDTLSTFFSGRAVPNWVFTSNGMTAAPSGSNTLTRYDCTFNFIYYGDA
jgi:hypothetical protein